MDESEGSQLIRKYVSSQAERRVFDHPSDDELHKSHAWDSLNCDYKSDPLRVLKQLKYVDRKHGEIYFESYLRETHCLNFIGWSKWNAN